MLRFDSIHLPPPPPPPSSQVPQNDSTLKTPLMTSCHQKYNGSTLVAQRTKYMRQINQYNMPFPPSNPLKTNQQNNLNYSSDTDTSLINGTVCCSGPLKFKWFVFIY